MVSKILLSGVGTSDPLTILGDGPIVHIVRHYHPDKVVLLSTPNMMWRARQVRELITEVLSPQTRVTINTVDLPPHEYVWVEAVRNHLRRIAGANPNAEILLNVSSGTPAMSSAFVALHAFGNPKTIGVQVVAPDGHADREQFPDWQDNWEYNPDQYPSAPNRCLEIPADHLAALLQRENIKAHLLAYDYDGAAALASQANLPKETAAKITELADIAALRQSSRGSDSAQPIVLAMQAAAGAGDLNYFVLLSSPATDLVIKNKLLDKGVRSDLTASRRQDEKPVTSWELLQAARDERLFRLAQWKILESYRFVRNKVAHDAQSVTNGWLRDNFFPYPSDLLEVLQEITSTEPNYFTNWNEKLVKQIDKAPL